MDYRVEGDGHLTACFTESDFAFLTPAQFHLINEREVLLFHYNAAVSSSIFPVLHVACLSKNNAEHLPFIYDSSEHARFAKHGVAIRTLASGQLEAYVTEAVLAKVQLEGRFVDTNGDMPVRFEREGYESLTAEWPVSRAA